jgi:hypothetical protein
VDAGRGPTPEPDLAARTRAARDRFGANVRTRVVEGLFLFVEVGPSSPLFDEAAQLVARALPPLLDGRFGKRPDAPITVLFFTSKPAFVAFTDAEYGTRADGNLGLYDPATRSIATDASGGRNFLTTLTHEMVHPLLQAEFPDVPFWFGEAIASVFEAPVFTADGGIHGARWSRRQARLVQALASPRERDLVRIDSFFGMDDRDFAGFSRATMSIDTSRQQLHYALARSFAVWLDAKGQLWPFYHAWRDSFASDPTGEKAFTAVTGMSPTAADAAWLAWAK